MYLLVIFLYISGMRKFIALFIMLLTVGNMAGFSKTIVDLGENSNEIVSISDYDQVMADVNNFEMVALELRVMEFNNMYRIKILQKRYIHFNIESKSDHKAYRLNYHKAIYKVRTNFNKNISWRPYSYHSARDKLRA